MSDTERVEMPEVSFSLSGHRLTLRDEAGGGEVAVDLGGDTSLTRATTSWFDVPIDAAVSLETESMRFPYNVSAVVRDAGGDMRGKVTEEAFEVRASGTFIDVSAAMKVLVYVESGRLSGRLVGDPDNPEATIVEFDEPRDVVVGARSHHETPTATMTVPDDPEALMTAVSHLGSSIKEWSAERSWGTLRGHPPAIETGETLEVPEQLSVPSTEVTVTVPPDTADVLRVAPLAHYFGAEVVPGDRAALSVPGHTEPLGSGAALETAVDELVARSLVLDSLVRIDGYYSNPRYEYDELAPELPFYPPALYDEPIHRQLLEYLEVPFEEIQPYAPRWPVTGMLRPRVADAEALPSLLDRFAPVRVTPAGTPRSRPSAPSPTTAVPLSTATTIPPGVAAIHDSGRAEVEWVKPQTVSASVLFVGVGADEGRFPTVDLSRFEAGDTPPTATYRASVTRDELRAAVADGQLYLHYGGEVQPSGFVCSDGVLGFDELPAGSLGAVSFAWDRSETAPLAELCDAAATVCLPEAPLDARTVEQLGTYLTLGAGVASSAHLAGVDCGLRFVGDPSVPLAKRPSGRAPHVVHATRASEGRYHATWHVGATAAHTMGRLVFCMVSETHDKGQLAGTPVETSQPVTASRLEEYADGSAVIEFTRPESGAEAGPRRPGSTLSLDDG